MKYASGYGRRISQIRNDMGMSRQWFAQLMLSPCASGQNIRRIELEDVTPKPETLERIADRTGISLSWITTGKVKIEPNKVVNVAGIGERIRNLRQSKGMSAVGLARKAKLGNTAKNVTRLEDREHLPRGRTVARLAKALNVSTVYLATGQAS